MKYRNGISRAFPSLLMLAVLCIAQTASAAPPGGLTQDDFKHLARGGFGDPANNYSWSVASFKGDLYVGVNRHHGWGIVSTIGQAFGSLGFLPSPTDAFEGPKSDVPGDRVWAEDFRGAIWRYRGGKWSKVHQSGILYGTLPIVGTPQQPAPQPPITGYYPESYGYRNLAVYQNRIYAIGIGPWVPNMPYGRIMRSATGEPGSWQDISGAIAKVTNPRGLIEYRGRLFVSASLPGTAPGGSGTGLVFCLDPASPGLWKQVSELGFGSAANAEVPEMAVFNGCLYASTVNYATGFEVWKTDGTTLTNGKYLWKRVIRDGFGDTWNQWGMTMQAFGGHLYVGTAVGGMVFKNDQPVGMRAVDVIRIDANDKAQLLVGAYRPNDPPAGWPRTRVPLSGRTAGFANPLNTYVWSMGVYEGWLYLGTFDQSSLYLPYLGMVLSDLKSGAFGQPDGNATAISLVRALLSENGTARLGRAQELLLGQFRSIIGNGALDAASAYVSAVTTTYGGGDVWKTKDGVTWVPVTLNGFDNYMNFGIRRLTPLKVGGTNALVVGTGNGFTGRPGGGCEVLYAK
jgi:hypothetical protein